MNGVEPTDFGTLRQAGSYPRLQRERSYRSSWLETVPTKKGISLQAGPIRRMAMHTPQGHAQNSAISQFRRIARVTKGKRRVRYPDILEANPRSRHLPHASLHHRHHRRRRPRSMLQLRGKRDPSLSIFLPLVFSQEVHNGGCILLRGSMSFHRLWWPQLTRRSSRECRKSNGHLEAITNRWTGATVSF